RAVGSTNHTTEATIEQTARQASERTIGTTGAIRPVSSVGPAEHATEQTIGQATEQAIRAVRPIGVIGGLDRLGLDRAALFSVFDAWGVIGSTGIFSVVSSLGLLRAVSSLGSVGILRLLGAIGLVSSFGSIGPGVLLTGHVLDRATILRLLSALLGVGTSCS